MRRADAVVIFLLNLTVLDDFGISKKSGAPGAPYPWQQHETVREGLLSLTQRKREFSMVVPNPSALLRSTTKPS